MANSKIPDNKKAKPEEPPKVSIFSKRPSMFSGGSIVNQRGGAQKSFIPPVMRFTQHKGGGGK